MFSQKRVFWGHLGVSEYLNWFLVGKVVAQDPGGVHIKHSVQFRFRKNSTPSVWVWPLVKKLNGNEKLSKARRASKDLKRGVTPIALR